MQPNNPNNRARPSLDGVRRPVAKSPQSKSTPPKLKPEYRPDHELPAPEPQILIEAHEPATKDGGPRKLLLPKNGRKNWKKWLLSIVGLVVVAIVAVAVWAFVWYQQQLAPASTDTSERVRVVIEPGAAPSEIADELQLRGAIRSSLAFTIYTKLTSTENNLKAGVYNLQPSLSTPAIVDRLVEGKQDAFRVTFLPGDTLANNRKVLLDLGIYSAAEIDAALNKTYDRPLFATKPASADLEGYLYGETIEFDSSATVETILNRFFAEFERVINENDLVAKFKKQGLTLYEGITLASIVQREVPGAADQRQIARVFLNRMDAGMTLGSDVTYQYAAKKMGVAPHPSLDSPYNTRKHTGLPPGPIATPGKTALLAVANPASNEYLFFLSGDDDVTYFATTDEQHQQNITNHCQKKCLIY